MLTEHRGEAEFDFRSILHTPFLVATKDEDEFWRLVRVLLTRPDSQLSAAVAGWERPISLEAMVGASLYTTWSGEPHPLMPDVQKRTLSDVETRLADMALENMKGGNPHGR